MKRGSSRTCLDPSTWRDMETSISSSAVLRRTHVQPSPSPQDELVGNCRGVPERCFLTELNPKPLSRMRCDAGDFVEWVGSSGKQAGLQPPPVVRNPYSNVSSARAAAAEPVAVTPDAFEKRSLQPPRSRVSAASGAANQALGPFEPEGVPEWEAGEKSGFKQSPSLIPVRDVYPPELSRFV